MATPRKRPEDLLTAGRKTLYREEYCNLVQPHFAEGKSVYEVANAIGVPLSTMQDWRVKFPEFSDAIKKGLRVSRGWWEAKARENLDNPKFQAALWFMNMKNRFQAINDDTGEFRWADKHEVAGDGGGPLSIVWGGDTAAAAK